MLARHTTLILANTVAGAALGFVALKAFAVWTGPFADGLLGQLAFALGLAGLLSVAADMGFTAAHVRRVSEGRELGSAVASFALAKGLLALAFVAVATLAAALAAAAGVLQDTPRLAVVLVAVYVALLGLRAVFTATFDGRREFAKTQVTVLAENVVRAALVVLFAVAFGGAVLGQGPLAAWLAGPGQGVAALLASHSAVLLAASYAAAALVSVLVGWLQFRRGYPFGSPSRRVLEDYWGFARHIFLAAVVGTLHMSLDKVVVTAFWEPANTGRYFGAQRFSDLIAMVPLAVYTVLFPALSQHYARGDRAEVRAATEAALRHVSMVVVPLACYALALAGPLLSLVLTGVFGPAVPTLRVLALYAVVFALLHPYASLLHALGRPDATARAAAVALGLNAALSLILVPPRGTLGLPFLGLAEVGAALATLLAIVVQFALLRRAVHALEGPVPLRHTARHALAGLAMVAALLPLAPPAEEAPWFVMLGLAVLGGLVYLAALAALREFNRRDLGFYLHLLDPGAMARHIAEEVRAHGPKGPRGRAEGAGERTPPRP